MNGTSQPTYLPKHQQLKELLAGTAPLAVAFSGGVDSTLLLKVAAEVLPESCCAVTVDAPYLFRQELAAATRLTCHLNVRHLMVPLTPELLPGLYRNPADRCYWCKNAMLTCCLAAVTERLRHEGNWTLVDGSIADDQYSHRPGRQALAERQIRSPLAEVGFDKAEVRALSNELGLPNWDKPAQTCLLTRFPHNLNITAADLKRVEQAEEGLLALGFSVVRVRSIGTLARVECAPGVLATACFPGMAEKIKVVCQTAGFSDVLIDPTGYRSGSMDQN